MHTTIGGWSPVDHSIIPTLVQSLLYLKEKIILERPGVGKVELTFEVVSILHTQKTVTACQFGPSPLNRTLVCALYTVKNELHNNVSVLGQLLSLLRVY